MWLTFPGTLSEYTTHKLDSIKSDLATKLGIRPAAVSFSVPSDAPYYFPDYLPPEIGVTVKATMLADAAADLVARHAAKSLNDVFFTADELDYMETRSDKLTLGSCTSLST